MLLTIELTAINQYFIQSKMCATLKVLSEHFYKESIEDEACRRGYRSHTLFGWRIRKARYGVIKVGSTVEEHILNSLALK